MIMVLNRAISLLHTTPSYYQNSFVRADDIEVDLKKELEKAKKAKKVISKY